MTERVGRSIIAPGPNGLAQPLKPLLSPAYGGGDVTFGGPLNSRGQVLAEVLIGRSARLMKLTPAIPCESNCIVVSELLMQGQRVPTIAHQLFLSPHTVRNHLKVMFRKAGVRSQVELIEIARRLRSG